MAGPLDEGHYVCDACGAVIVVPTDPSAGAEQTYVEDCPVCCRPNVLTVRIDGQGRVQIDARAE